LIVLRGANWSQKIREENKKEIVQKTQEAKEKKVELTLKKMAHIKEKNALLTELIERSKKPDLPKEKK
jgi:hypothetical protein